MSDQGEYGHYSMIIEWYPRDGIYVVTVPELPGCQTHGETLDEAVKQGRDAIEGWVDVARAYGDPIPPPHHYGQRSTEAPVRDTVGVG